jgi:hypothetical protein
MSRSHDQTVRVRERIAGFVGRASSPSDELARIVRTPSVLILHALTATKRD